MAEEKRAKRPYNLTKSRPNKKEQIVEAACKVMCHYGYDGTTLDKIAAEAAVSKSLISKHFGSKEEIAGLCLGKMMGEFFSDLKRVAEGAKDYLDQTERILAYVQGQRDVLRLLVSIMAIPALEHLVGEIAPDFARRNRDVVNTHAPTGVENLPALAYTMTGLYFNYALTGREVLHREARDHILAHYQNL